MNKCMNGVFTVNKPVVHVPYVRTMAEAYGCSGVLLAQAHSCHFVPAVRLASVDTNLAAAVRPWKSLSAGSPK